MEKVLMDTVLKMNGKTVSVQHLANQNIERIAEYSIDKKFVLIGDAYLGNNSKGGASYFAPAVMLGDEILDGEADTYLVEFEIIDEETEDGNNACDWSIVENYEELGAVETVSL
jgi:hypothetical protein